jgi:tape measure domain-containing protein
MAATDLEKLVVSLSADLTKYERGMARAQGITNKQLGAIQRKAAASGNAIGAAFARAGAQIAGAFAAQASLAGAQELIDAATRIQNALKVAGLSGVELDRVYQSLFASAQKNAAPLESLVTLYGRASIVQKELGVSTEELLGFTNNVAVALRVAGTDAQTASGALLQLSQALGSGTVRAEEFNAVLDGALPIAQAAAAGLEEAGGSVAKLRGLIVDGKVSSEAFFRAFEAGSVILEQKVANSTLTTSQQFERLQNTLIDVAGKLDVATGASTALGGAIEQLGAIVTRIGDILVQVADSDIAYFVGKIASAISMLQELGVGVPNIYGALGKVDKTLQYLGLETQDNSAIQGRIDQAFSTAASPKTGRLPAAAPTPAVNPVSIKDFAPPSGSGTGSKGGGKSKQSEYAREVEQIRERTAALQAETDAQKSVCGTIFIMSEAAQ